MTTRRVPTMLLLFSLVTGPPALAQTTRSSDPGPSPTLGARPPADARTIVLFDGEVWEGWRQRNGQSSGWKVQDDRSVLVSGGDAITTREFGDIQLHIEFACPIMPGKEGQARGNSGVYLLGRYEVQVLDTYGLPVSNNGCGALYSIAPPLVNASRPPGSWQSYDIIFRAPRINESGAVTEPARATVIHNGIVIHNNRSLPTTTPGGLNREFETRGPLLLQHHGDPVRYRNIWLREL